MMPLLVPTLWLLLSVSVALRCTLDACQALPVAAEATWVWPERYASLDACTDVAMREQRAAVRVEAALMAPTAEQAVQTVVVTRFYCLPAVFERR